MKKTGANCLLLLLLPLFSLSQESSKGEVYQYARKIVDTLASPSMHGRGYVKDGDKIAAKYIAEEFKKLGLLSFKKLQTGDPKKFYKNYLQYFEMSINTFPGKMDLAETNGVRYEDGISVPMVGFRPDPSSPSIKGKFKVVLVNDSVIKNNSDHEKFMSTKFKKSFLLIDTIGIRNDEQKKLISSLMYKVPKGIAGVLYYSGPYQSGNEIKRIGPWDVSQQQGRHPIIEIKKGSPIGKSITIKLGAKYIPEYTTQNVIGYIKGTMYPDSYLVYTAHYDHLGEIGENGIMDPFYFPGANDNASGIAMLLNLAKYYSAHPPKYSIAFMAFGAEEAGLLGSKFYTEHPWFPLKFIKFLVNFDIMGTGEDGIKVVNAPEFNDQFKMLVKLNAQNSYLKEVQPRGKTANSDHYFFYVNGVKCFYIYTLGGIKAYHDIYDRAETLPLTKFEDTFKLMTEFTDWLQEK